MLLPGSQSNGANKKIEQLLLKLFYYEKTEN